MGLLTVQKNIVINHSWEVTCYILQICTVGENHIDTPKWEKYYWCPQILNNFGAIEFFIMTISNFSLLLLVKSSPLIFFFFISSISSLLYFLNALPTIPIALVFAPCCSKKLSYIFGYRFWRAIVGKTKKYLIHNLKHQIYFAFWVHQYYFSRLYILQILEIKEISDQDIALTENCIF